MLSDNDVSDHQSEPAVDASLLATLDRRYRRQMGSHSRPRFAFDPVRKATNTQEGVDPASADEGAPDSITRGFTRLQLRTAMHHASDDAAAKAARGRYDLPGYLDHALLGGPGERHQTRFALEPASLKALARSYPLARVPGHFSRTCDAAIVDELSSKSCNRKVLDLDNEYAKHEDVFLENLRFLLPSMDVLFQLVHHLDPHGTREHFPEYFYRFINVKM